MLVQPDQRSVCLLGGGIAGQQSFSESLAGSLSRLQVRACQQAHSLHQQQGLAPIVAAVRHEPLLERIRQGNASQDVALVEITSASETESLALADQKVEEPDIDILRARHQR